MEEKGIKQLCGCWGISSGLVRNILVPARIWGSQAWGRMWLPGAAFPILCSHLGSPIAPRAGAFLLLVQLQRGICS